MRRREMVSAGPIIITMTLKILSLIAVPLALAAVSARADYLPVVLPGLTDHDGWNSLTRASYPDYATQSGGVGTLPSYTSAWPAPFDSNIAGSGDALFNKVSGSGSFAGAGVYQGGGTAAFSISDNTVPGNLGTLIFQLESNYDEASSATPFLNGGVPTLFLNGGGTGITADFSQYLPDAGVNLPSNSIYAYQWNLSSFADPITSFSINWNGPASSGQITGLQLDQGAQFAQVVGIPEPSAAMLLGALPLGLLITRRRRAA